MQGKQCASSRGIFNADAAVMGFGKSFHYGKSQAQAARFFIVDAVKLIKNLFQRRLREPRALIGELKCKS